MNTVSNCEKRMGTQKTCRRRTISDDCVTEKSAFLALDFVDFPALLFRIPADDPVDGIDKDIQLFFGGSLRLVHFRHDLVDLCR